MIKDVKHYFIHLKAIWISPFVKSLIKSFVYHFLFCFDFERVIYFFIAGFLNLKYSKWKFSLVTSITNIISMKLGFT